MRPFPRLQALTLAFPLTVAVVNIAGYVNERLLIPQTFKIFAGKEYVCEEARGFSRNFDNIPLDTLSYGTRNGAKGFYDANCR